LSFPARSTDFDSYLTAPPRPVPPLVFTDEEDAQHALADYRGKVVVLKMWATWCGPCVLEMPELDALQDRFSKDKLIVIPLTENGNEDAVNAYYAKHQITRLPIALDKFMAGMKAFQVSELPVTVIIDKAGREVARISGPADWSALEMLDFLKRQTEAN